MSFISKPSFSIKNNQPGFTMIELLVVIAIIGMLASFAMMNLMEARNNGRDAAIVQNLTNARGQAQYYGQVANGGSYDDVCDPLVDYSLDPFVQAAKDAGSPSVVCVDNQDNWAIEAELMDGNYFCISEIEIAARFSNSAGLTDVDTECDGTPI